MEKLSLENKTQNIQILFLSDLFSVNIISKWVFNRLKFFPKFDSFVHSIIENFVYCFDNSKVGAEKELVDELATQNFFCKDDGKLGRDDVNMVMGKLGFFCSSEIEELPECFSSKDFSEMFEEKEPSLEELKEAFNVFDENKDGFIDERELQRVLCLLGLKEGFNLEICQQMIRNFDENRDGRIDFIEFIKFMETNLC